MHKILIILFFLIIAGPVDADNWPVHRGDALHAANSTESLSTPLSLKWKYTTGDKIVSSAAVVDGKVVFGSRDKKVYALNVEDGTVLWSYETGDWVDSSPTIDGGNVYVASRDGYFYSLKLEDGSLNWKHQTSGTDTSSPVVADGKVVFGNGFPNKRILALAVADGQVEWEVATGQMVYSSPVYSEGYFYIGANDSNIYKIDGSDGSVVWKFKTNGGIDHASPAMSEDVLYMGAGNFDWKIYAVDATTSDRVWEHLIEDNQLTPTYVSSIAVGGDRVLVVSGYARQYLYCIRKSDGQKLWKAYLSPATRNGFSSSPIIVDDEAFVVTARGKIMALDLNSGNSNWSYDLKTEVLASPSISDGILFIGTLGGDLYAFD